jgi:uncharacterized protein with beta-barrel porin domain
VSPGSAISGFPPGIVNAPYVIHRADGVSSLAQSDLTTAYNVLAGRPPTSDLTGVDLGGLTLGPGVYNSATTSGLTGTVTLDGRGDPNAVFIFNIGTSLTTGTGASVALINGAQGANVYFRVGSSATLGASTLFAGRIFALTSITLVTGAQITCGAALARNGAVTLDTNTIAICPVISATATPTPVTPPPATPPPATPPPATPPPATPPPATPPPATTPPATPPAATPPGAAPGAAVPPTSVPPQAAVPPVAAPTPGTPTPGVGTPTPAPVAPVYAAGLDNTASANQRAVAGAIDTYASHGGVVPVTFQVLRGVFSARQLASTFTQLSGEAGTGVGPTNIAAMHSFMALIFDAASDDVRGVEVPESSVPPPNPSPLRGTVHSLGYAEEDRPISSGPFGFLAGGPFTAPPKRSPWSVWGAGYGGQTMASGDAFLGSHDRSTSTYGFAAGAGYRATRDTKVGFVLAGGRGSFDVADGLGGGQSDMFQAAIYARTSFGPAYVTSAIAYAWDHVQTSREVKVGGHDLLTGTFSAQDIAGQIEAGYRFGWIIPYAAVGLQAFHMPSYSERSAAGPSIFALSVAASTTLTARTQLGFRVDQDIVTYDNISVRLRGRAAWAHDTSTRPFINVTLQSLPGSEFSIYGTSRAADSLLVSAGPEVGFGNGISVAAAFEGQIARGFQSYYGNALFRYVW